MEHKTNSELEKQVGHMNIYLTQEKAKVAKREKTMNVEDGYYKGKCGHSEASIL